MVLAIARAFNPKQQTRRVMAGEPVGQRYDGVDEDDARLHWFETMDGDTPTEKYDSVLCPYGKPGTQILVKEAAWVWCNKTADGLTPGGRAKYRYIPVGQHVIYSAEHPTSPVNLIDSVPSHGWRLKIERFLSRWAVRTRLEIVAIRAERLQDISEADALAEGITWNEINEVTRWCRTPVTVYKELWESINGDGSWDLNPWVWVITFKKIEL